MSFVGETHLLRTRRQKSVEVLKGPNIVMVMALNNTWTVTESRTTRLAAYGIRLPPVRWDDGSERSG
jgi:hypothetical protein